tara:strand:+ start:303 stop:524 length:222 start_codon:yes stop_codon:yes gene_type:complete
MKKLDLHGIKHEEVEDLVTCFINSNFNKLPIEIITGNSADMQQIIKKIIQSYKLKIEPTNYINLGSYIISRDK